MGDSSFTLSDGLVIHTPIILVNKQVLLWDAPNLTPTPAKPIMPSGMGWEEWTDDVWRIFELITPRPGEKPSMAQEVVVWPTYLVSPSDSHCRNHRLWNGKDCSSGSSTTEGILE